MDLSDVFFSLCEKFAANEPVLGTEAVPGKKLDTFLLEYRIVRIEFVFKKKGGIASIPNTLYCRIYPEKNSGVFFHLPELFVELDINDFRACYFPRIESEQRMNACFDALCGILSDHWAEIEEAAGAGRLPTAIAPEDDDYPERRLRADREMDKARDWGYPINYTVSPPYAALLLGDREKALEKYGKKADEPDGLYEYERRLYRFLSSPEGEGFEVMPPKCASLAEAKQLSGLPGILAGIKIFLLLYAGFALFFCLLIAVLSAVSGGGALLRFGVTWQAGFLLAALPALFGKLALRRQLYGIVSPKNKEALLNFDRLSNGKGINRAAYACFGVVTAAMVILAVLLSFGGIRFYADHGVISDAFASPAQEQFDYSGITAICRIGARHNASGERIERGSYVLLMDDGRRIDLDGWVSEDETEEKVFPLLVSYDIESISVNSDWELPDDTNI